MTLLSTIRILLSRLHSVCVCLLVSAAVIAALSVGRTAAAPPKQPEKYKVRAIRGITYHKIRNDPDAERHKLDIYRPAKKGRYPVLFFIHGGGWVTMSKDDVLGILGYATIARCLAERGLVVVVPNYRLSPAIQHPEHIKDVAQAFAWTYRHCKKYGGNRKQIFVGGHSAGGHLAALLTTDENYLKKVGRRTKDIAGVIGISGVYQLDAFDMKWIVSGPQGIFRSKVDVKPLAIVFGDDAKVIRQASPINHVRRGLPPFLLLSGGWDYPPMLRMAKDFSGALQKHGVKVCHKEIPWRTHETLLFDIPHFTADATTTEEILRFIQRNKR